ncbi:uncharacterized protein LOC5522037 isoform X3 [Nematostella vectensis]|uniref:uncharacterized protein LOC5522037 isoform X3 n=1 Tax=Nematostella vectensis TaxID=45351 RepID=UPI0020774716|nr:uncharacterized protein LOC5522037 isoform X3 [Nematostella vectensis]
MIEPLGLLNLTGAYKKHWLAPLTHTIWETRHLLDKTWGRLQGISLHPNFISQKQIKMTSTTNLLIVCVILVLSLWHATADPCTNDCERDYLRCFLRCDNQLDCAVACGKLNANCMSRCSKLRTGRGLHYKFFRDIE